MIWRRLRDALTRPIDPVLWAFDWRPWVLIAIAIALIDTCTGVVSLVVATAP